MVCIPTGWMCWFSTRQTSCVSTMIVVRRSLVARSLGRSLARSLARSIDHSLARSLARSIARSLTDMCSLQSQYNRLARNPGLNSKVCADGSGVQHAELDSPGKVMCTTNPWFADRSGFQHADLVSSDDGMCTTDQLL